jgi:hypothetical protein
MPSWTAEERRALSRSLHAGAALRCPACGGEVRAQPVATPPGVPYVRRRALLSCPACRKSGAFDITAAGPP